MKVGLLIGSFASGGAQRMMVNLAKGLKAKGADVTIYVINKTGPYLEEVPECIPIQSYEAKFGVKSVVHKIRSTLRNDGLTALISTQRHINAAVGWASLGLKSLPILIYREANTPSEITESKVREKLYKKGYRLADHYVAVSIGVKEDMIDYYGLNKDQVSVIYNPVVDDSLKEQMDKKVNHPWFSSNYQIPVIVGMGRFNGQKGFEDLIKAFSVLRKKKEAKLVIFGERKEESSYYKKVSKLVADGNLEDDIEFPGFVNNPFKYLSKASLFVLSSKFEGLPGALIQAMACSCPVISTDCHSGPREILEDGKYGPLVKVGDVQGLANAMISTIKNPIKGKKLKERSSFFSIENATEKYLDLIKKIASD